MSYEFVHLHAHSEYSLDCGFLNISDYVKFCYENDFIAAAITERFNLFSAVKFYNKCFDFGIKPILGCEVFLECDNFIYSKTLLLCKNYIGYRNLLLLLTKAHLNSLDGIPLVRYKWLLDLSDGLIAVGVSLESDIGQALLNNNFDKAHDIFSFWNFVFKDRYYLSISRLGVPGEVIYITRVIEFSHSCKISLVVTNEVAFLRKSDLFSYQLKMAMFDLYSDKLSGLDNKFLDNKYFKSYDEMQMLFLDMPEVIYNTAELAKRCNLFFKFGVDYSPKINSYQGMSGDLFLFRYSFNKLLLDNFFLKKNDFDVYVNRLKVELSVIISIGFVNYFLVTYDFISWAKKNDIFIGPGRGSGAGSLIAYLLLITISDPIKNDLLFERFLNKDRISSPDFDVDFCIEGRDLIIDYIFNFYGVKNVAQIVTFGCMTIKSVVRDIGRVLGYSYNFIDKIIKLISSNSGVSLKSELVNNSRLRKEYDNSNDVQTVLNLSLRLEGILKGIGKHAGGVIISSVELLSYLPLQYEFSEFNFITQFDKDDAELFGFTKFDFLGLKTLTITADVIDTICSYFSFACNFLFDFENFQFDDFRTYILLSRGDTLGIFQFESSGMRSILQKVQPDVFSDIVSLIALYRPGPLQSGLLLSFTKRKHGFEKIDYINDVVSDILMETYGMIVYQEQVMLIAQVFANYSLADADYLRIAMSKKKLNEMAWHLENFVYGASFKGFDKDIAEKVFYLIEKFAGYGFNKAHSVGYALLAYNSSWFKANYTIIFLSVLFSADMDNSDIDFYIDECEYFGIRVVYPDINRSSYCFTIVDYKTLLLGFGAIKGLGKALISEIIFSRAIFGFYNSFFDFLYRMDMNLLTKKVLQSIVYSGAFDNFSSSKFKLVLISNKVFDLYIDFSFKNSFSFESIVDKFFKYSIKNFYYMIEYKNIEFANNRYLLGKYLFYNPINYYVNDILFISKMSYKIGKYFNEFFCGVISSFKPVSSSFYLLKISGLYEERSILISVFRYKNKRDLFKNGKLVVTCLYVLNNYFYELLLEDFYFFRCIFAKYLDIYLAECYISDDFFKQFFLILFNKTVSGETKIRLVYFSHGSLSFVFLNDEINISLHDDVLNELNKFKEIKKVSVIYNF